MSRTALRLRPRPAPSLLVLVAAPAFLVAGVWQLERAELKAERARAYEAGRMAGVARLAAEQPGPLPDGAVRPVAAEGRYLDHRSLLHDNRIHAGRAGYHVLTPFRIAGSGDLVLVNRGWVPAPPRREVLPGFETPEQPLTITGLAVAPPRSLVIGPEEPSDGAWPRVVQAVDLEAVEAMLGRGLLPFVVLLDPELPAGFVRDWQPFRGIGPDRHRAYALQWFTFAALALVVLAVLNLERREGPR